MKKSHNRIIYYDFSDLNYSSYFLSGLIERQNQYGYRFSVSRSAPAILDAHRSSQEFKKNLFAISLFEARIDGDSFFFCIDSHDNNAREFGYNLPLLESVRYYFKVNHHAATIDADPELRSHAHKIYPLSPNFPVRMDTPLRFMPRLYPCKIMDWTFQKARRRVRRVFSMLSLAELRQLRQTPKDIDVFFAVAYYQKQSHSSIAEARREIVERLIDHPQINAFAGLVSHEPLPSKLARLQIDRFDERTYLTNIARSKMAIYVRGPHECHSFKLGELLAMAKPIVGQTILNNPEELYAYPHFSEQYAFDNPQQIVDQVANLLEQPTKVEELARSNGQVFDTHMTPAAVMERVLKQIIQGQEADKVRTVSNGDSLQSQTVVHSVT